MIDSLEKRVITLENDRDCLMKFKTEMNETFKKREPAKDTYKFMGRMETSMALNIKDHEELKDGIKSIEKKLDDVIQHAPSKDNSWAEGVLKTIGYIILVILVTAFMYLVIKNNLIR